MTRAADERVVMQSRPVPENSRVDPLANPLLDPRVDPTHTPPSPSDPDSVVVDPSVDPMLPPLTPDDLPLPDTSPGPTIPPPPKERRNGNSKSPDSLRTPASAATDSDDPLGEMGFPDSMQRRDTAYS
jgi:hypothetical protein